MMDQIIQPLRGRDQRLRFGGALLGGAINMVTPTGLTSPRGYFNLDWITLVVMIIVFIVGAVLFALARGGKEIDAHLRDDAEKPAAVK